MHINQKTPVLLFTVSLAVILSAAMEGAAIHG